jgi:hypothetical protein
VQPPDLGERLVGADVDPLREGVGVPRVKDAEEFEKRAHLS